MHLIKYNLITENFPLKHNKSNVGTGYKEEKSLFFGCFSKLYLTKWNYIVHLNMANRMWVQGINRRNPHLYKPIVTYFVQNVNISNNLFVIMAEKWLIGEWWKTTVFLYWEDKDMVVHMFIVTNIFEKS